MSRSLYLFLQICFADHAHYEDLEMDFDFRPCLRVPIAFNRFLVPNRLPQRVLRALPWFDLEDESCKGPGNEIYNI